MLTSDDPICPDGNYLNRQLLEVLAQSAGTELFGASGVWPAPAICLLVAAVHLFGGGSLSITDRPDKIPCVVAV